MPCGSTPLPPLLEHHISALGQFPLILVLPRPLAWCVTRGLVLSRTGLNQRLGDLTECGYLGGGGGLIGLSRGGECCSLLPCQYPITVRRSDRTSLDICVEIDWIFLDVELKPLWKFVKPDCTSASRVFVAVTLVLFTDDRCFRAGITVISIWAFETVRALTVTAGCIEGVGLGL